MPFHRILVATDCSPAAGWAVGRAARLPIAKGGKLVVAHVLPEEVPPKRRRQLAAEAKRDLQELSRQIQGDYRKAGRGDVSVSTVFRVGPAYREILHSARAAEAELIVLGKHGRRTVRDLLLGSTAEKILHGGSLPVLIVSRRPSAEYRRVAVALDLEDTARTTLQLALRASCPGITHLSVIHAYAAPFEGAITHAESDAYRRACRQGAESRLREIVDPVGGVRWEAVLRYGDPRAVILREANRRRADLLALGTHGRSGLSHFLLGSVAEYAIRSSKCDVLVARPRRFAFALP